MNPIATIGYERAPLDQVIDRLHAGGVELVIDVRAVASSRRAGFSKTLLGNSLIAAGVGYTHLRDLGTPKAGREAARAGRTTEMQAIFNAHLATSSAQAALETAILAARDKRACLLCYEDDPACCHRTIVAETMAARTGAQILHL
ncbi:MAG: DUF488 domain-containing protein [Caulobacteraceae bacterium]